MCISNPSINAGIKFFQITALAENLPNAQLVAVADGGHMLLNHVDEVRDEIGLFISALPDYQAIQTPIGWPGAAGALSQSNIRSAFPTSRL